MTIGVTSGIDPAFQPSIWPELGVMSATIRTVFPLIFYFFLDLGPHWYEKGSLSWMKPFDSN